MDPAQEKELQGRLADLENEMVVALNERMMSLEKQLLEEVHERKRHAEKQLEDELCQKRRKIDDEIFDMEEDRCLHETRLAIASEQLQERMQLVSDEQKILDDLREKSRAMQKQFDTESVNSKEQQSPTTPSSVQGMTESEKKELLKNKLAKFSQNSATPRENTNAPATPSPAPTERVPEPTSQAIIPTSDQRFTSSTHPQAWHSLYRITKSKGCDAEIYKMWHEGGEIFRG